MGIPCVPTAIRKRKETPELKNVYEFAERHRLLSDAYAVDVASVSGRKVLLVDDLYRSGATMNAITESLYDQGHAKAVFAVVVTRTRSRA